MSQSTYDTDPVILGWISFNYPTTEAVGGGGGGGGGGAWSQPNKAQSLSSPVC